MQSKIFLCLFISVFTLTSFLDTTAIARERERPLRPGRPPRQGNENSQPVSQVTVGTPSYGGNGCPQGTMKAVFAADSLSFSLLFDQFVAEATEGSLARKDEMSCDAIIPLQIPEGMQMQITRVDLRGFVGLPNKAKATLHSMFNFKGRGGDGDRMNLRFNFEGPKTEDYFLSSDAMGNEDSEVSPCGGSFNLRIMNQLKVRTAKKGEPASITLDSVDGSTEAVYFVNWQSCAASNSRRRF